MVDWDEINKRKRKEINLGMAKNGAIHILKCQKCSISEHAQEQQFLTDVRNPHWSKLYKETARLLFLFNEELDKELLEGMIEEKMLVGELEVAA